MNKGADIFADAFLHLDVETGFRRNFKAGTGAVGFHLGRAVPFHPAFTFDNFHDLGLVGAEMEGTWVNQSERLLAAVGKENGMRNNLAVEVHIGLRHGGYIGKLSRYGHARKCPNSRPRVKSVREMPVRSGEFTICRREYAPLPRRRQIRPLPRAVLDPRFAGTGQKR